MAERDFASWLADRDPTRRNWLAYHAARTALGAAQWSAAQAFGERRNWRLATTGFTIDDLCSPKRERGSLNPEHDFIDHPRAIAGPAAINRRR
jgi:hypothetical protein